MALLSLENQLKHNSEAIQFAFIQKWLKLNKFYGIGSNVDIKHKQFRIHSETFVNKNNFFQKSHFIAVLFKRNFDL